MTNNSEPLVSVCIPVYGHEDYVKECIESVINQTYRNIELIIIDDGSPDGSKQKIEELLPQCKSRFNRFEFRSRPNKGLCNTLNEALDWCRGDFFCAIASDDVWLPDKTRQQVDIFLDSGRAALNIGVVAGEMLTITHEGVVQPAASYRPPVESIYDFDKIYHREARITAPTAMIKMEAIRKTGGYNAEVITEDYFMWLALSKLGYTVLATDTYYAKYRDHGNNTYKKIQEMHASVEKILVIFSRDASELAGALADNNERAYKAAAVYRKKYAVELAVKGKINPFSRRLIFSTINIMIPERVFFAIVMVYRKTIRPLVSSWFRKKAP
ncbi:MAG: glycosyltransferase family 2 protein [bacterium]|nr:glycosyltransferase family 2 protein [bacterium]